MLAPYGLNILDNCVTCPVREQHLFCNLSPAAAKRLNWHHIPSGLPSFCRIVH
jgi:hypothetical protein